MPEPAACYQSAIVRYVCSKYGQRPHVIHIPTAHVGYYREKCCPACRERPGPRVVQATPVKGE
jgi:hypothetical protein